MTSNITQEGTAKITLHCPWCGSLIPPRTRFVARRFGNGYVFYHPACDKAAQEGGE